MKQNSCLVYENLCLQLEVDNLHLRFEKMKLDKTRSETNSRLKYIKHESSKPKRSPENKHKKVRIKDERPEKDESNKPSTNQTQNEEIRKIFERYQQPGIPEIKLLSDFDDAHTPTSRTQIPSLEDKVLDGNLKKVTEKPSSKLTLFQVSSASSRCTTSSPPGLVRVRSSPEIASVSKCRFY